MPDSKKSLLAQLGFADPDLNNPQHELACAYLQTASGQEQLINHFLPAGGKVILPTGVSQNAVFRTIYLRGERDRLLSRGRSDRRKILGFVDIVLHHRYLREDTFTNLRTGTVTKPEPVELSSPLLVDVMIQRQEVGVILRRFKLLTNFIEEAVDSELSELKGYRFVLVTAYAPTPTELRMLDEEGIQQVVLGTGFERYVEERRLADSRIMPFSRI